MTESYHKERALNEADTVYESCSKFRALEARAIRTLGLCPNVARHRVKVYRRVMYLKRKMKDYNHTQFSFGGPVDDIWHLHVLDTKAYKAFCGPKMIHHFPETEFDSEDMLLERLENMRETYKKVFGIEYSEDPETPPVTKQLPSNVQDEQIKVVGKTLSGQTTIAEIRKSMTIYGIKLIFSEKCNYPVPNLVIIFAGRQLEDDLSVHECEIKDNSVLHLVLRITGC